MTPYVQREVFRIFEQNVFARARRAVGYLSNHWNYELRCHELARAVHKLLDIPALSVVDGKLAAVEHTWLNLVVPVAEHERTSDVLAARLLGKRASGEWIRHVIIDVYAPGRLPQVQLIDPFPLLKHGYEPGAPRTDINQAIVTAAYDEMRSARLSDLSS